MPGEKLAIGPINSGLQTNRTAFMIDNDSFPNLVNAYQWRGRIKRKRGTAPISRLMRGISPIQVGTTLADGSFTYTIALRPIVQATDLPDVVTTLVLGAGGPTLTLTDDGLGNLLTGSTVTGSINYITGAIAIFANVAFALLPVVLSYTYYPALPVMGLEDFKVNDNDPFIGTLGFDTRYSYQFDTTSGINHDVSYYKNPPTLSVPGTVTAYTPKTTWTPLTWTGQDYQQFWSCNYQGAFWAVNNTPGMQFQKILNTVVTGTPPPDNTSAVITLNAASTPLEKGDFIFIYETPEPTLNGQTGYVTNVAGLVITVTFPYATLAAGTFVGGIIQLLTNSIPGIGNGIRWYDGDPTIGGLLPPTERFGWVNFAPPLSSVPYAIGRNPLAQYYLCGAKMVMPFKGRLIFLAPWITTAGGTPIQLQDTIICSADGTVYYTSSFPSTSITTPPPTFTAILVPDNQSAYPKSFWTDIPGFGYYVGAGVQQPIVTANPEKDVLIIGFTNRFAQFAYTGNDLLPFLFYSINVEWGAGSTFSGVTTDRGAITIGNYGLTLTGIDASARLDLAIPDQIFQINAANNGQDRVCSQRDYINEWIYFTYPASNTFSGGDDPENIYNFPCQTLFYNYRDQSWALFNESYTTYGAYRESAGYIWSNLPYKSWDGSVDGWSDDSWDDSALAVEDPQVIAGNQEGFVLLRTQGTNEAASLFIQSISGSWVFTVPNHCLFNGDYVVVNDCLGATDFSTVNGTIFSVTVVDANTITLTGPTVAGNPYVFPTFISYIGGGLITRFYVPVIQTKQFPTAWGMSRKTRIGTQQYLFTKNPGGQVTAYIFLSQQDTGSPYNYGPIVPTSGSLNNALVYSSIVSTGPELDNLQTLTAPYQAQIWHRQNTSLIGDTVQVGFTLSDDQMRDTSEGFPNQMGELELHSFIFDIYPSQILA